MEVIPICLDAKELDTSHDLAGMLSSSAEIRDGDVLVVSQKAVSKQEGRTINLSAVRPTPLAEGIASQYGKDPRIVELVLSESARIVRMRDGIIITETRSGIICANAGVDESNVPRGCATLLPSDPDASARRLQSEILGTALQHVSVIISDTFGRPFRMGQTDCAIGVAGLCPITDYAGRHDSFGRHLRVTAIAVADEIASAAELVMGKTGGCPAAIVRGLDPRHVGTGPDREDEMGDPRHASSLPLLRPRYNDLFA